MRGAFALAAIALASILVFAQTESIFDDYVGTTHWSVQLTEEDTCGGGSYTTQQYVTIAHNGNYAEVSSWGHGPMQGTWGGNLLAFPRRTISDPPGTSTLSAFDLVFSPDCDSFAGSYDWVYSGPDGGCTGTTSLSGTRTDGSGCPSPSPSPTPEITPEPTPEPTPEETPTPEITPSPSPSCAPVPPPCPTLSGTQPRDPGIASGSLCRGACGSDCPGTCTQQPEQTMCVSDGQGCFYECTYSILQCGTNAGCRTHDNCYDTCSEHGESSMCPFGFCHCQCDIGCFTGNGLSGLFCPLWMFGYGPYDSYITYSTATSESGPMQTCP